MSNMGAMEEEIPIKVAEPSSPPKKAAPSGEKPAPPAPKEREWFTASFDINLEKSPPGEILGLELDPLDREVMQVCTIRDGLVKKYNASLTDKENELKLGDWIVGINGVKGRTEAMVERFQADTNLKVSIRRLKSWEVTLKPSRGTFRPCLNRAANGRTLLILDTEEQALKDWNAAHPDLDVRKNDRILMVNGVEAESDKMMEQVEQASELNMLVGRPNPA